MLTLVLLALLGLTFWAYRSRLRLALKAATIGYVAIIGINLVRLAGDEQGLATMAIVTVGSLALWGLGWLAVSILARRKAQTKSR